MTGDLAGWRVLVTRPLGRGSALLRLLDRHGAVGQALPLIEIEPPTDTATLDTAVLALAAGDFTWVGFTSVNAVTAVVGRAAALRLLPVVPADTRVAVVGPATAAAAGQAGLPVDLMPTGAGSGRRLAQCWPTARPGDCVLLPQSAIAAPELADGLRAKGFDVRTVTAYRTIPAPPPVSVAQDLGSGRFGAVLFTSPSTVAAMTGVTIHRATVVGAIGASTAAAARATGLTVAFTAAEPTDQSLIDGLLAVRHLREGHR